MPPQAQMFIIAAVAIIVVACIAAIHFSATADLITNSTTNLGEIMSDATQKTIDDLTAKLEKVRAEYTGVADIVAVQREEIAKLKEQVGTAADFSRLEQTVDDLDAITPDAEPTEPVEPTEPEGDLTLTKRDDTDDK